MPIRIDASQHPIIIVTFTGHVSDADYDAYHAELAERMTRARREGIRLGVLIDGRASEPPTAMQRRRAADELERLADLMKVSVVGIVIVLANALQRGVLTAVLWARPFAIPHLLTAEPGEGVTWLRESLRRRTGT